jgi:UPF0271 protein
MAARDPDLAAAVARAAAQIDRGMMLFGLPGSALLEAGRREGIATACEAFPDRAYQRDGTLVPRSEPHAVIEDPELVARRAVRMVVEQAVEAIDGSTVPLTVHTLCVHGDTPGAAAVAERIRAALVAAKVRVSAAGAG